MELHSYHIFYFPFKWENPNYQKLPFSERVNLKRIKINPLSDWVNLPMPQTDTYVNELYNEKNFFYPFVHPVLYDKGKGNDLLRHYERKETANGSLTYTIKVIAQESSTYELNLRSIVLNLYSTGVGMIMFYLENNRYPDKSDILRINQFGRRVYPPFLDTQSGVRGTKAYELADSISISGLNGSPDRYSEDFESFSSTDSWKAARFIDSLIKDLSTELEIRPVIDDRMHVLSWFGNQEIESEIKKGLPDRTDQEFWYKYLFVDADSITCQHDAMVDRLIDEHTYRRCQKFGSWYGISRYSMVFASGKLDSTDSHLLRVFRTIYSRMVELSLVQRATILKFSNEVTRLSTLNQNNLQGLAGEISLFYREYIRFINQVYQREITAQEQGIELYKMIQEKMSIPDQVKDLDEEIGELHNYASLLDEKNRNRKLTVLSVIGSAFIIPTLLVGYFSLKIVNIENLKYWIPVSMILIPSLLWIHSKLTHKVLRGIFLALAIIVVLAMILLPIINKQPTP